MAASREKVCYTLQFFFHPYKQYVETRIEAMEGAWLRICTKAVEIAVGDGWNIGQPEFGNSGRQVLTRTVSSP